MRARVAVGAVLATLAAGGVAGVAMHKNVTLDVDGHTMKVSTMAMSVDSVLRSQGYTPADGDQVSPGPDAGFGDGSTITMKRLKTVVIDVDDEHSGTVVEKMSIRKGELVEVTANLRAGVDAELAFAYALAQPASAQVA